MFIHSMPMPVSGSRRPRLATLFPSLIIAALGSLSTLPARAAGQELSLDQAVSAAAEHAPLVLAREASRVAAAEELARADALPDPSLVFGVQNFPIGGPEAFTVSEDRMTMRRIGVTQALPSRAKRTARRQSAEAALARADAESVATVLEVKRAAAKAWVALWAAEREHALLQELRDEAGLAVRATRARLSGDSGSASDVLAARSTELELENRLDDAAARIEQARAGLARWLGEMPARSMAAAPDFSEPPLSEARLLASLDRHGALLAWDAREAAADAAVVLAQAETRPDWSIGAGFAQRGDGASDVVWLEIGVGLPLFTRNRQDRGISARAADREAVRATRDDARRIQAEYVRKRYADWAGLTRQVRRYRDELLPLNHDRTRTALAAYSGGAPLQAWLDARRNEIDLRIDYADVLAEWGQAWADLAYLLPASDTNDARIPETVR
ncbi:TolC family protein [Luteimonas vadosa]|uniref:TolC family protein n=1 Tax=Luteimonas vadosa TaxID=1165507 RepID=A0ABP9E1K2_9GAMM